MAELFDDRLLLARGPECHHAVAVAEVHDGVVRIVTHHTARPAPRPVFSHHLPDRDVLPEHKQQEGVGVGMERA